MELAVVSEITAGEPVALWDEDDVGRPVVMEDPLELGGGQFTDEHGRDVDLMAQVLLSQHGDQGLGVDIVDDGSLVASLLGVENLGGEGTVISLDESHVGHRRTVGQRRWFDRLASVGWFGFDEVTKKTFALEHRAKVRIQSFEVLADAVMVVHGPDQGFIVGQMKKDRYNHTYKRWENRRHSSYNQGLVSSKGLQRSFVGASA